MRRLVNFSDDQKSITTTSLAAATPLWDKYPRDTETNFLSDNYGITSQDDHVGETVDIGDLTSKKIRLFKKKLLLKLSGIALIFSLIIIAYRADLLTRVSRYRSNGDYNDPGKKVGINPSPRYAENAGTRAMHKYYIEYAAQNISGYRYCPDTNMCWFGYTYCINYDGTICSKHIMDRDWEKQLGTDLFFFAVPYFISVVLWWLYSDRLLKTITGFG